MSRKENKHDRLGPIMKDAKGLQKVIIPMDKGQSTPKKHQRFPSREEGDGCVYTNKHISHRRQMGREGYWR